MNISYDEAFETKVSADIKVRFGGASTTAQRKKVQEQPVINALTATPRNRGVRVHDATIKKVDTCFNETEGFLWIGITCDEKIKDQKKRNKNKEEKDKNLDEFTTLSRTREVIYNYCSNDTNNGLGYSRNCVNIRNGKQYFYFFKHEKRVIRKSS